MATNIPSADPSDPPPAFDVRADQRKDPSDVAAMFDVVAPRYDLINGILSLGQVHLWRAAVRKAIDPQPGQVILDVAGGTGTSAAALRARGTRVVVCDISEGMVEVGRGKYPEIEFVQGSATDLPFEDNTFDAVTVSFGIRNFDDVSRALREMLRVTKPGGRLVIAEFSTPLAPVRPFHHLYVTRVVPQIARLTSPAGAAYDYLSESIVQWHDQEALARLMIEAGWIAVAYRDLTFGTVALHRGFKAFSRI